MFGKMYRYREKVIIRVIGQPMFFAEAHHYEQARCRECGHIARAPGPACVHEGVGSDYVRYDWSACAMMMVMHYSSGSPSKRMESLHEGWGVPLADANQWVIANTCDDLLLPLSIAHERHAIRTATNFRIDDTHAVVIELQKQIKAEISALEDIGESTKDVRTGINATGSYWETPDGPVILFYTGRHHAGEIVDQLLEHRPPSSPKLIKSTDAASKNFGHAHGDKLIETVCNAHALLKFRDIKDRYPVEYAEAGSVYKQVFDNDDKIEALKLSPADRMLYHRQHSPAALQALDGEAQELLRGKAREPAGRAELSNLGAADLHHQSVGPLDPILRGAGGPARHEPRRAGAQTDKRNKRVRLGPGGSATATPAMRCWKPRHRDPPTSGCEPQKRDHLEPSDMPPRCIPSRTRASAIAAAIGARLGVRRRRARAERAGGASAQEARR